MPERWKDSGALRALREITRIGARLHHVLGRRTGLGPTDLTALELLSIEMMGPADLARHLDITTAAATGVVDRLEARGHVVRRPIPGDRRRTGVHITDAGRQEAWLHLTPMFAALQANDAQFTEEERAVVERYLTGAVNAINTVVEGDPRDLVDGAG